MTAASLWVILSAVVGIVRSYQPATKAERAAIAPAISFLKQAPHS
jgi:hypothetical protein